MKKESIFRAFSFSVNILLISSVLLTLFGLAWEYSTRRYLEGFSNAVIPYATSPENKVAAILSWMEHGPARQAENADEDTEDRDPIDTLNYKELLSVCGTATNAFVNLASAGGLETRRLLLLDEQSASTNHVVAEVRLDGRWVIVDPSFHVILKDSDGHLLTRQELARPEVLRDATRNLTGYDPAYNYEHTTFVHLSRVPLAGRFLQGALNSLLPSWQERVDWAVLVERQSNATFVVGIVLLCFALGLRQIVHWYGLKKFQIDPMGPWEELKHAGVVLFAATSLHKSEGKLPTA